MIKLFDGNPGQGKTYMLANQTLMLLVRNKKWFEKGKTKTKRKVVTNMALNEEIQNAFVGYIDYWTDLDQLVTVKEADLIFDDMSTYLDSQRYMDLPVSVKRWLRLHEHYGVDIYGNAQDFLSIDISVRRLVTELNNIKKLIGSRRPSATKPAPKIIWGILVLRTVSEMDIEKERIKRRYIGVPHIEFIKKKVCHVFDTTQDLNQSEYPPLQCIIRNAPCGKEVHTHR